ncbi:hypothetical protein MLD38_005535 [Melastoma candidum]|uniref:Uncharacterized protein n=1 Tax=Melastoma candidum TaxID=119954 RepID=A0ACB9RK30_9MYRT|nr:hypothetical protein MLD38_005535 [Melastoma candidum]
MRLCAALNLVFSPRRLSTTSSSSSPEIQSLYSFLQPSIFSPNKPGSPSSPPPPPSSLNPNPSTLPDDSKAALESTLRRSILVSDSHHAWTAFKTLASSSAFPDKTLTNSLIAHLASPSAVAENPLNVKRAFASAVYVIEKRPSLMEPSTVSALLDSILRGNSPAPAFALVRCMFGNRFFVPFEAWGGTLVEFCRRDARSFSGFLRVFEECCRVAIEEKLDSMRPDLGACNAALEGSCRHLESIRDAEKVVEVMSVLGIRPDAYSFGFLGYLYALKALPEKVDELEVLMGKFGISDKSSIYSSLISGYLKAADFEAVSRTVLRSLRESNGEGTNFGEEVYLELTKEFLDKGSFKELANLIVDAQKLENVDLPVQRSIGFGIVNACISLGRSDKAHSILDEMNIEGASVGLGVYLPIIKSYCKEQRTAEATQLVTDISSSGLQLDAKSYEDLIDASMASHDFQSAFSLFRDMREARIKELKGSYLAIMTGLMENHRPELMAAFLDEVVEDPRIEVGTHDWNSIIHAFCKAGRVEDARRTFRRMTFLQFGQNEQTYLSLISGYVAAGKYFGVLLLWNEVKKKVSAEEGEIKFSHSLVDAFLYALVKGGFFDAVMQVVQKSQDMKIFMDKWRYKQAYMETHKKLKVGKLRKRNQRKMEALVAFKNWAGLNT